MHSTQSTINCKIFISENVEPHNIWSLKCFCLLLQVFLPVVWYEATLNKGFQRYCECIGIFYTIALYYSHWKQPNCKCTDRYGDLSWDNLLWVLHLKHLLQSIYNVNASFTYFVILQGFTWSQLHVPNPCWLLLDNQSHSITCLLGFPPTLPNLTFSPMTTIYK